MYDSVNILNNNFKHFPGDLKMRYLLSDMIASIANYIVSSLELRKFLITKLHRTKIICITKHPVLACVI